MSSESIVSPPTPVGAPEACRGCGAPLADDQRYCLECGERRTPMSSVLLGGAPVGASSAPSTPPSSPPSASSPGGDGAPRGGAVTLIAGVGVLLLAMGVGVLIGRSGGGSGKQASTPPPQVISVSSPTGSGTSASGTTPQLEAGPPASKGRKGYTRRGASSSNGSGSGGSGASEKHPASPAAAEGLSKAKGKSYEEKSKNLPDVISTG